MMTSQEPALRIEKLSKSFGGVKALQDVDLIVKPGEVLGLLGQNGSGKSTLVKILTSVYAADGGAVSVFGSQVTLPAKDPKKTGIAVVHQDIGLEDTLTVFENVEASVDFGTKPLLPIPRKREWAELDALRAELKIELDLDAPVSTLSPAKRTLVGVLRAMRLLRNYGSRTVLIMDEPTSALSAPEAKQVTNLLRRVAESGAGVMFISHRLGEVLEVCDAITVLKDGVVTLSQDTGELTQSDLTHAMLGLRMESFYPARPTQVKADPAIVITDLKSDEQLNGITVTINKGEIVGFTGLTGMGQEDLPALLSGQKSATSGSITIEGHVPLANSTVGTIAQGVALVPGNRARDGGWLEATAAENVTLPVLKKISSKGVLYPSKEVKQVAPLMSALSVRPNDPRKRLGDFSGGNQQKIVMAKWLQTDPKILILDEPTQGVDAGAKHEILTLIVEVANKGGAVVMVSGDHEQLAHTCNRVFVLHEGRIVDEQIGDSMSEESLIAACNRAS